MSKNEDEQPAREWRSYRMPEAIAVRLDAFALRRHKNTGKPINTASLLRDAVLEYLERQGAR